MILKPAPTTINRFTYHRADNLLTAEMSDLRGFGRVFDDACDEGLTVVGATGREVTYVVTHVEYDREGDLRYWNLAPARAVERALPTMTIWND